MTQPTLLELAKQGDENAINSIINYLLKEKGITAQAAQKDDCLLVLLKSEKLPDQQASVAFIHKLILKLEIASIKSVKIYGKQIGESSSGWTESLDLIYPFKEPKQQTKSSDSLSPGNQKATNALASGQPKPHLTQTITNRWPKWFPYPSSWFRALILIPLITSIIWGSFIFAGWSSYLLLAITNSREVLFLAGGLMLLLPTLSLAYVHYFFSLLRGKQALSTSWLRWLPSRKCLWLGFYDTVVLILCTIITLITLDLLIPQVQVCNSYETAEQIATCREFIKTDLEKYAAQYPLHEMALVIWVILPAYLYQDEYLIRQRLFPNQNVALSHEDWVEVEDTNVKDNSQHNERELNQTKKGMVKPHKTISPSQQNQRKSQKLAKKLLIIFLIPSVAVGIYLFSQWPQLQKSRPLPIASQALSPAVIPSPVTSQSPAQLPQLDVFRNAVNKAMSAATHTQSAKSKEEWNLAASEWQEAIALMKAVPSSHAQHSVAQQKAIDYQGNLDYAQKNATNGH